MKNNITIHVLVKESDANSIEKCLKSFSSLKFDIKIGNCSCSDQLVSKLSKFSKNIFRINEKSNHSKMKNELMETSKAWIFWVEPQETMLSFEMPELEEKNSYHLNILSKGVITKQIRLFHKNKKIKFKNPVHEFADDDSKEISEIYLKSDANPSEKSILVDKWFESEPLSNDALYYKTMNCLINKDYKEFINMSQHYIFQNNTNKISTINLKYYRSLINYAFKNYQDAIVALLDCILERPYLAEYWCLLGDIHCQTQMYEKAKSFYRNAVILGSQRPKTDLLPYEIDKYKKYPEKMIKECSELIQNTTSYKSINHI